MTGNRISLALLLASLILCLSCQRGTRNRVDENKLPHVILWAWERPENLEFLDSQKFGVAFLAQTIVLKNDDVVPQPRRNVLQLGPTTKLIAVTRIESQKITRERATLSDKQLRALVPLILKTADLKNVAAIQVDFDAVASERVFYRQLLEVLRRSLPDNVPLSMTALASFCIGDRWLTSLPVDEAIPMVFRMGTDSQQIKTLLTEGHDFREQLCRRSYGIALDEPLEAELEPARRLYVFNSHSWTPGDVQLINERIGQ